MATFDFLRLSLSVPRHGPLDTRALTEPVESRAEYLREVFGKNRKFFYRRSLYAYVPGPSEQFSSGVLGGFIGRQRTVLESDGPEAFFALSPKKKWQASFLAIDTHPEAQVVAIERRPDVGASISLLEHLVEHVVAERQKYSWHTDIEHISRKEDFWKAARQMKGRISELAFTFHPANGLKGFDRFKAFDRLAKQQTNSETSEYALKNNDHGVVPEGEFVESAVDYASEGGGQIIMKDGRKTIFNSRNSKLTEDVPENVMPREGEPIKIVALAKSLLRRFSREAKND